MTALREFIAFFVDHAPTILEQTLEHIGLTFAALFIAVSIAVPLGIWITRKKRAASPVLGVVGILQTIPSIALLGFMIPLLGIGAVPAIAALFLYALLPIVQNTYTGIEEVDEAVKEAGRGMGMSDWQLLWKVEFPLALPVIFAGIRTATIINIGVATLAALIASGGLGEYIFGGIALNNTYMILAGAVPAALLAILFDIILARVQKINFNRFKPFFVGVFVVFVFICGSILYPALGASPLQAGFTYEFVGREDGYPALKNTYQLDMQHTIMHPSLMYMALKEKTVDVISGYSTDGRVKAYHLKVLEDNKKAFPPYHCAPVIRQEVLKQHPKLEEVFKKLKGKLDNRSMQLLNYRVDHLNRPAKKVARHFLDSLGLLDLSQNQTGPEIVIGSKLFTEQYILCEMFKLLIESHTNLSVVTKTGLGGSKLCFDALVSGEIDIYPEYTGTALVVILNTTKEQQDSIGRDKMAVYRYVDQSYQEKYKVKWLPPLGFNNTYALMMRKEQAKRLELEKVSELKAYLTKKQQKAVAGIYN